MLSLVVALGPLDSLGAVVRTLGAPIATVTEQHPAVRPSLTWSHPRTGRTIGRAELDRFALHASAWEHVVTAPGPVLVLEPGASVTDHAVHAALADDGDWSLVALDGVRAYLLHPSAAAELVDEELLADAVPLAELFGLGGEIDDDDEPVTDHLAVLEVVDRFELADALAELEPNELVVAVPPAHRILATATELGAVYAQVADGMVLLAASRQPPAELDAAGRDAHPDPGNEYRYVSALGIAGPAGAIAAVLASVAHLDPATPDDLAFTVAYLGAQCAIDSSCALFQLVDPDYGDAVAVHGRVVNGATDTLPAVVLAPDADALAVVADELDADGARDLARVFRYDDAVDLSDEWQVVAPDIVVVPFWTPEFCATIIRLAEAAEAWDRDVDDPVPGAEVSLAALSPRLFGHVQAHVDARVLPVLAKVWPDMARTSLHDAFIIKYAAGANDELRLHHDVAQISGSLRLSTTYRGGRLEFPRQGWDNGDLEVGRLAIWPSLVTHPHRSTPVEAGVKYGVTLWWKLPE